MLLLIGAVLWAAPVSAHAVLLSTEPADRQVMAIAPKAVVLTFNEPVTPLVIRLIGPDGVVMTPPARADNAAVVVDVAGLGQGTHVLSWRVISADGHPVGGALTAAKADGKHVLLDFGADWCPDCRVLGKLFEDPAVAPFVASPSAASFKLM